MLERHHHLRSDLLPFKRDETLNRYQIVKTFNILLESDPKPVQDLFSLSIDPGPLINHPSPDFKVYEDGSFGFLNLLSGILSVNQSSEVRGASQLCICASRDRHGIIDGFYEDELFKELSDIAIFDYVVNESNFEANQNERGIDSLFLVKELNNLLSLYPKQIRSLFTFSIDPGSMLKHPSVKFVREEEEHFGFLDFMNGILGSEGTCMTIDRGVRGTIEGFYVEDRNVYCDPYCDLCS